MAATTPHDVDTHVGRRIRARRNAIGQTQQDLSKDIGLTFQQVQKYERGANRVSASKLVQIARAQKTPVAWYFEGLDDDGASTPEANITDGLLADPHGVDLIEIYLDLPSPFRASLVKIGTDLRAALKKQPSPEAA